MAAPGTFRAFLLARGEEPSPANLGPYLAALSSEDWGAEFKTAALDGDYQLRKAVASLANHEGGELFLGVDDSRTVVGTQMTIDTFYAKLRQPGATDDWFLLDLALLVVETKAVPLPNPTMRVLVAEIRKAVVPGLVVDDKGVLIWYERRGRSDHALTAVEWIQAKRRFARGKLLLQLYREFEAAVRTIPQFNHGEPVGEAHFSLPRFAAARADGSLYTDLSMEDRSYLLAHSSTDQTGFSPPGLLPRYVAEGVRLDAMIARFRQQGRNDWEAGPGSEIRVARENWKNEVGRFADYLRPLGVLP